MIGAAARIPVMIILRLFTAASLAVLVFLVVSPGYAANGDDGVTTGAPATGDNGATTSAPSNASDPPTKQRRPHKQRSDPAKRRQPRPDGNSPDPAPSATPG